MLREERRRRKKKEERNGQMKDPAGLISLLDKKKEETRYRMCSQNTDPAGLGYCI